MDKHEVAPGEIRKLFAISFPVDAGSMLTVHFGADNQFVLDGSAVL